jgi:acetyl-CoA carboxylase biotin carboxyl carrier protein
MSHNANSSSSEDARPDPRIDFDEIRRVITLLEERNLSHFELEIEGFKIKISRNVASPQALVAAVPVGPQSSTAAGAQPIEQTAAPDRDSGGHIVASPMVGTFYRAPNPTASPFVEIGDVIKKGQTLCIIEAMKLMNEIEADIDGIVTDILVENAKPVEYGQKLFSIQPQL